MSSRETEANCRADLRKPRGKTGFWLRLRVLAGLTVATVMFVVGSLAMLLFSVATLFQSRRFCAEVMARWMSRIGLWLCGVRIVEHRDVSFPQRQTVYISNHTSTLDMFVLIALGLPRTRYFLSGFLRAIPPLALTGYLIGIFWTALQKFPDKRTRLFQRAEGVLRRTGDSVFLTPEGQQTGVFNKGAFHLATNLGAPIQPIFIWIPNDVDPGPWTADKNLDVRPGVVHVYYRPPIDTSDWTLDELEQRRDECREFYADWQRELNWGDETVDQDEAADSSRSTNSTRPASP